MSTYMYVKCPQCGASCDTDMLLYMSPVIKELYLYRKMLCAFEGSMRAEIHVVVEGYGSRVPDFMIEHHTHVLELRDEYGHLYDWETLKRIEEPAPGPEELPF